MRRRWNRLGRADKLSWAFLAVAYAYVGYHVIQLVRP